ncbi:MAG: cell division protein FtsW [Synechococcus sp. MED-G71]|nr:MAG: cell division protein FtsW [Synechococcus sp. MED-G71]|tara:strand:+ start:388 stop:1551 length:1164 start_codon:yes stop_codon:yes gene_type:complete
MPRSSSQPRQGLLPLHLSLWPAETRLLLGLVITWSVFGLLVLTSASWWISERELGDALYTIKRQVIWMIAGWGLFLMVIRAPMRRWLRLAAPALLIGTGLVALTLVMGTTVNGASRWLVLGPIQLQPTELIKPFVVLQGAMLFSHWRRLGLEQRVLWLAIFAGLILLILKQPNLSTAALTGLLLWLTALASGLPLHWLVGTAGLGFTAGTVSILVNSYQRMRVTSFLDPWQDPQGHGYQLVQSLLAIGSGGISGSGYGLSTQKLMYLPIQTTDFIFAVYAEEFGFIGSVTLLLFLSVFALLGLRVALRARGNQLRLVAIGCTTLLVGQSILNIAVASGAMPTTGLPLPLVSYGGNSLLASLFTAGLLVRCSLETTEPLSPSSQLSPS